MKILILPLAFLALVASKPPRAVQTIYSFHFTEIFGNQIQNSNSASPPIGIHKEVSVVYNNGIVNCIEYRITNTYIFRKKLPNKHQEAPVAVGKFWYHHMEKLNIFKRVRGSKLFFSKIPDIAFLKIL